MEYWEFLIQKEGDRSWQPIKSPKMELEAGRYRVVAHSSRPNTEVEICLSYISTEEVPPKRRSQKRSRRTNAEGLMVVIPYTHLKPGLWELRCGGDIMSDFLGNSWQEFAQLQVLPKTADVLAIDVSASPVLEATLDERESERDTEGENIQPNPGILPLSAHPILEVPSPQSEQVQLLPAASVEEVIPVEPLESDEEQIALTSNSVENTGTTNPLLDQSLQMLEEILQQVLDPVLQEFEPSNPVDLDIKLPEPELLLEEDSHWQGLTLTLDDDALVARRGESLAIAGRVDLPDVDRHNGGEPSRASTECFQGSLRYELRDPQTSKVLLDVQQPLAEQKLPSTFNHALEMPSDCNTRLILGKATLYGSTSAALASQPFTITVDVDELLGAIIPGSKVMPVAKMLVLASNPDALQEYREGEVDATEPSENQTAIDLIDVTQNLPPLALQPISQQTLPPQLYQPTATSKSLKSLHLPSFPKAQSVAINGASSVEVKQEDVVEPSIPLANDLSPETPEPELKESPDDIHPEPELQESVQKSDDEGDAQTIDVTHIEEDTQAQADSAVVLHTSSTPPVSDSESSTSTNVSQPLEAELPYSVWDDIELSDVAITITDSEWDISEATPTPNGLQLTADEVLDTAEVSERFANGKTAADAPLSDSEVREVLDAAKGERQLPEDAVAGAVADDSTGVDNAFQALNLQDRFWLRLNSLVADADLLEWLKSELSPPASNLVEVEEDTRLLEPDPGLVEVEDVTPSLDSDAELADFDESLWEESEEFGGDSDDTVQLQPPLEENQLSEEKMPVQLPSNKVATPAWAEEFVVEDEEQPAPQLSPVTGDASGTVYPTQPLGFPPEPRIPSSPELELPLPAPTIFVPMKELAAGEPVTIRIKLPPHSGRLCIKLWIQDRQSRSLLDGPRWLVDLIPDGAGQLEAMTQLIVPFGSVEIRFEAIAVDIYTQRESHKVTVDCVVVPPDLPNISLDEFED